MAEDCYDEVLLENSPLSQYLKEACPDLEFETVRAASGERTKVQHSQTNRRCEDSALIFLDKLKGVFRQALEWTFPPVSKSVEDLNVQFLPQYSSLALDSGLLLDADRQMIQAYCPRRSQDTTHQSLYSQLTTVWICGRILCALAVLCAVLGVLFRDVFIEHSLSHAHAILCFTVLFSSVACAFHWARVCWIFNSLRSLHQESIECTGQCLRLLDQQGVLLRRSIRYIQEVEVISRGFTMVSAYTPVVRLESTASSKQRQCIVLRKACFSAARAQFNALRGATLRVMKQHPLVAEIDHVSNYLAMVKLEDAAPWIEISDEDESQDSLSQLTGCFSLAALKAMNSLFLEQRSEFIRRLVLCTCPDARLELPITADALSSWLKIIQDVNAACEAPVGKLQRSYDCHRQRPSQNKDQTPSDRLTQGGGEMQSEQRVNGAVRSLRLHLEATLNRVISVEEALEGRDQHQTWGDDGVGALTSKMLDAVKRELTASQDCLQEAVASLEKMNSNELMSSKHTRNDVGIQQCSTDTDSREPIVLLPMTDTEIEFDDQIFEAYTDTEPGERDEEDWGERISDAEKLRRRREAEETKRMLQELRSVLLVRQAERERMKLERSHATKRAKNDISPSDISTADGEIVTCALGAENKSGAGKRAENDSSAIDVKNDVDRTNLADRELSSGDLGNLKMTAHQDVRTSDSREKTEQIGGFSRDICDASNICIDDTHDGTMVNLLGEVGENAPLASKEPTSVDGAKCSSLNNVSDLEPHVSRLHGGGTTSDVQMTNASRLSGYDTASIHRSQDLENNQSTGGSLFIPTQGQRQFGLSFLPSLAAEAAMKSRQCRQAEETFIGGDEDSSESEEIDEGVHS